MEILRNIPKAEVVNLANLVAYADGQVVSKTLVQNSGLGITLFAFAKDEGISTHESKGDAMVVALDGKGRITIDGKDYELAAGDTIVMPANALQPKDFSTAAREVFERYPDVDAISGTDLGAICALREASRRGRRCPDDLSIVAYDGTYLTRLGPQTMTAVVQPIPTLGRRAAEAIVRRIRHEELPSLQPLPMGFQQGETC